MFEIEESEELQKSYLTVLRRVKHPRSTPPKKTKKKHSNTAELLDQYCRRRDLSFLSNRYTAEADVGKNNTTVHGAPYRHASAVAASRRRGQAASLSDRAAISLHRLAKEPSLPPAQAAPAPSGKPAGVWRKGDSNKHYTLRYRSCP